MLQSIFLVTMIWYWNIQINGLLKPDDSILILISY
jgi:hypothetical protein